MKRSRADAVMRELSHLASAEDPDRFAESACAALARAVPFEFACLASTDPVTGLITGNYKSDPRVTMDAEFARLEYAIEDINQFREIAARPRPVGVLERDTAGHPERCVRFRDFLRPHFDQGHELRLAFRSGGAMWGAVAMYRPRGSTGFTDAEADFLAGASALVADGLSAVAIRGAAADPGPGGPAVLMLGPDDRVCAETPAATGYLAELPSFGAAELPMPVLAVAAAVRARRAGAPGAEPRLTLRTRSGSWLALAGAPLQAAGGDVVVTLEEARAPDVVPLMMSALKLTDRERDVLTLVLAGRSTTQIATGLGISAYTVQDHLRAIFDKAGVRSRRDLVASIFFEHYAPRIGGPRDQHGAPRADDPRSRHLPATRGEDRR
jgi:DNA-binding CsgD family transcriptional regulator